MTEKKKIALFVGRDMTAQLVLNGVLNEIYTKRANENYEPVVYLPEHPSSIKASLTDLKEFGFYERGLLNDVVFPFVDRNPIEGARNLSPNQLSKKFGIAVNPVMDVNSPEFLDHLSETGPFTVSINLRGFQIYQRPIIDLLNQDNAAFLNVHPGVLPVYRGVMSTVWAMAENAPLLVGLCMRWMKKSIQAESLS